MKTFTNYEDAALAATNKNVPLRDTHQLHDRYVVGHLSAEIESDPDNEEWEEVQRPQEWHYDVFIPAGEQPKCSRCGGPMHVRIGPKTASGEWGCLGGDCAGVEQIEARHLQAIRTSNPNM